MGRGILIAGGESSLMTALAAEAARRVEKFALAAIPGAVPEAAPREARPQETPLAQETLSWNPGSPVSARSLTLAVENRLGRLDEALLVCVPPALRKRAEGLDPGELELLVNDHIKGWFFLVRELALFFKRQRRGTLAFISSNPVPGSRDDAVDLLGPAAAASFQALAQGLITSSFNGPYQVLAFSSPPLGEEAPFASFIFKTIDEDSKRNSGKWHKYSRLGLFGR